MSHPNPSARQRAVAIHHELWGTPKFLVRAPGRVNLIGDHTDYNDGFVLPMALPFDTVLAVSRSPAGSRTEIESEGFGRAVLDPFDGELSHGDWAIHLRGVHKLLSEKGVNPAPWQAAIATDIPTGASLSSSAALEVATCLAILHMADEQWQPVDVARLGQRVENEIVGLPSGIMDQLISASAFKGHASLIDCQTLKATPLRLPEGFIVAVMDTKTRRQLVDSAFADRRETCASAAALMGVDSLRDAKLDDLDQLPADAQDERQRAQHVITENQRTLDAATAMENNDAEALGALMNASHDSLRDDYEVSGDALNQIVDIAKSFSGCVGARMTGGGFAGCAVALVRTEQTDAFIAAIAAEYLAAAGQQPTIWVCEPASGGSLSPI